MRAMFLLFFAAAAFAGEEPPDLRATVEGTLRRAGAAVKANDASAVLACVDLDRFLDRVAAMSPRVADDPWLGMDLRGRVSSGIAGPQGPFRYESFDVLKTSLSEDGTEGLAVVRFRYAGGAEKWRLWVTPEDGRIRDWEQVSTGVRVSHVMAQLALVLEGKLAEQDVRDFGLCMEMLRAGAIRDATDTLNRLVDAPFPEEVHRLRRLAQVELFLQDGRLDAARLILNTLKDWDAPVLDYFRARLSNLQGAHEDALSFVRRYVDAVGGDAGVRYEEAIALRALGRPDEASAAIDAGLAEPPPHPGLLYLLGTTGRTDEMVERFLAAANPALFDPIAAGLAEEGRWDAVRALAAALRKIAPSDPGARYYEAQALAAEGKHAEAAKLLLEGLAGIQDDSEREAYEIACFQRMRDAGQVAEAYRALGRKEYVFVWVARTLHAAGDGAALLRVADDHAEVAGAGASQPFWRGCALALLERRDEAEASFALAVERATNPDEAYAAVGARAENLCRARGWQAAVEACGARDPVVDRVAPVLVSAGDADALLALLKAHARSGGTPAVAELHGISLLFLRGEIRQALELWDEAAERTDQGRLYAWEDATFRALHRLGRSEAATQMAAAIDARDDYALYAAIVHAAAGRTDDAKNALARLISAKWTPKDVYADPDLGPLLRAEGAAALREVVPPPE